MMIANNWHVSNFWNSISIAGNARVWPVLPISSRDYPDAGNSDSKKRVPLKLRRTRSK